MNKNKDSQFDFLFSEDDALFHNFLLHTDQAQHAIQYLTKKAKCLAKSFPKHIPVNYLDIGCGYGDKTIPIIETISKTHTVRATAIDPSEKLLSVFKKISSHQNIEFIKSAWDEYQPRHKFHIITLIHILYFIDDWAMTIEKIMQSLAPNGKAGIVIRSNDQVCQFVNHFLSKLNPEHKKERTLEVLQNLLEKMEINHTIDIIESRLNIQDCLKMNKKGEQLIAFLFRQPFSKIPGSLKEEIIGYLNKYQNDGYLLHQDGYVWLSSS